ncbi:integrase_H2C2 domain-containing protein [Trichonephila clavipes]|nr:integrase_H2C2 domain-containing protein [Trichonephila clavipes]
MLNELYVYDLINSTSDATEALQFSEEMIDILGEAGMNLRRWATNSSTLHEAWKRANINCRKHHKNQITGNLKVDELFNAEKYWVRCVQLTYFKIEYEEVKQHKSVSRHSKLFCLNPVMTKDGLLCLGGRLQKSNFNFYEKHPLILPSKSRFLDLLIVREHQRLHHAGVRENLTQIRETYWIFCGRQTVKSCLKKCLNCRRFKVRPGNQITAPLPENRIQAEFPFETVGIDFVGPIYTKNDEKVYISLFTCAVTRALHLEVVSSLSTEHFY